jgi:hypothetical protein
MDEFIDELLREERVCDIILPRIQVSSFLDETPFYWLPLIILDPVGILHAKPPLKSDLLHSKGGNVLSNNSSDFDWPFKTDT